MRRKTIVISLLIALVGCSPPPTAKELSTRYFSNTAIYKKLMQKIVMDTGERNCFTVGTDNIEEYWKYGGQWTNRSNYETKLTLSTVLASVGLTRRRYNEYLELFRNAGAERIDHCQNRKLFGRWVRILVYRSGLAVSGCLGTIEWFQNYLPKPKGIRGEGDFLEVSPLENGWYSLVDCT